MLVSSGSVEVSSVLKNNEENKKIETKFDDERIQPQLKPYVSKNVMKVGIVDGSEKGEKHLICNKKIIADTNYSKATKDNEKRFYVTKPFPVPYIKVEKTHGGLGNRYGVGVTFWDYDVNITEPKQPIKSLLGN